MICLLFLFVLFRPAGPPLLSQQRTLGPVAVTHWTSRLQASQTDTSCTNGDIQVHVSGDVFKFRTMCRPMLHCAEFFGCSPDSVLIQLFIACCQCSQNLLQHCAVSCWLLVQSPSERSQLVLRHGFGHEAAGFRCI